MPDFNINQLRTVGFSASEQGVLPVNNVYGVLKKLSARKDEIATLPDSPIQYSLSSLVSPH